MRRSNSRCACAKSSACCCTLATSTVLSDREPPAGPDAATCRRLPRRGRGRSCACGAMCRGGQERVGDRQVVVQIGRSIGTVDALNEVFEIVSHSRSSATCSSSCRRSCGFRSGGVVFLHLCVATQPLLELVGPLLHVRALHERFGQFRSTVAESRLEKCETVKRGAPRQSSSPSRCERCGSSYAPPSAVGRPPSSRSQRAMSFAKYVRIKSAPARRIDVSASVAAARRSSQPRSAAAQIMAYSPLTL